MPAEIGAPTSGMTFPTALAKPSSESFTPIHLQICCTMLYTQVLLRAASRTFLSTWARMTSSNERTAACAPWAPIITPIQRIISWAVWSLTCPSSPDMSGQP